MQNTMKTISVILVALLGQLVAMAGEPRVAIFGDSITYSGRWPALVESALSTAPALTEAEIVNFGLASETVSGLSEQDHADGNFRDLTCTSASGASLMPSSPPMSSPVTG